MDFLFKDRGSGKRAIKPSKEAEHLEALIPEHESDDSDFELEKHKGENSDHESDTDGGKSATDDSSSSDSDDSGESDNDSPNEDEVLRLKSNMTTQELISLAQRQSKTNTGSAAPQFSVKVCGTCLRSNSDHSNEIVECDSCGVSVHEACYGIQEGGSIASNASAASTEPWFCEPCMAGVHQPHCEVCPNIGGIYKETDVGNWVHLVCALYIPQISFFDPERITRATLFELNYQSWGKRACCLCKDIKFARMPKKTKQWGWQCSECDKEPEMHPISYTPQIDIEAPRSSRNRGPPKANNLLCDSDVESAVIRDGPDIEFASETLKKHERKGIKASNLEKSAVKEDDKNTQPNDNTPSPAITSPPPVPAVKTPVKSGRKRGRPTTSSGKTENQENVLPPVKARRGRKPKASLTSPSPSTPVSQPVTTVTVLEPVDSVVPPTDNGSSDPPKTPPHELPPNLPPKKLFKNKATLKEVSSPPNDSTNFKNWLDAKLSPTKPLSDPTSVPLPLPNGLGPDGNKHLNDELSRTKDTPEAAPTVIKVRLGKFVHDIVDIVTVVSPVKEKSTSKSRSCGKV